MSLDPGGAVTSHPAVPSQPAGNGPPAVTGQAAGSGGGVALAEPAVVCAGVTYRFGDHVAVDDVDLTIAARRDLRPARPQRGGQDDHHPHAGHAAEADGRPDQRVRRGRRQPSPCGSAG